jgi:hypothetical protein
MKLEFLLQFIIPLTFLAIWALTSLLTRDAQPLPPRPGAGRVPGSGPGRPAAGGGFSPSSRADLTGAGRAPAPGRPTGTPTERPVPARWSTAPVLGRSRRRDRDPRVAEPVPPEFVLFSFVGGFQSERVARNGPVHAEGRLARTLVAGPFHQVDGAGAAPRPDWPGRSVHGPETGQTPRAHSALHADVALVVSPEPGERGGAGSRHRAHAHAGPNE